jgi:VIT1/CCC1 family predicted Fe2+/Mn2+ transporter
VFLLVFLSTFSIVIPFLVFGNAHVAMRASNLVAIVMLFAAGYMLGRHGGYHPWRTGLSMVVLGVVLVAITIALGG